MPLSHNIPVISRFLWMKVRPPRTDGGLFLKGGPKLFPSTSAHATGPFHYGALSLVSVALQTLLRLLAMPANPPATHRFAWFEKGLPDGYISSSVFPV